MIAENEVVLTYLLQLMAEHGILDKLAFKGGTCLRKMFIGSDGRFSTNPDFTRVEEHDHEDLILDMMGAFERPFHGIRFGVPDDSCHQTRDGLSWGVNPACAHDWNPSGQSRTRLQVSRREVPTLPPSRKAQHVQSYFRHLPFDPEDIPCLALPEIIAEKVRACCQRSKARDIHDLSVFATRPLDCSSGGSSCSSHGRQATCSIRKSSLRNSTAAPNSTGTISGNWSDERSRSTLPGLRVHA